MDDLFAPLLKLKQKLPKLPGLEKAKSETKETSKVPDLAAQAEKKPTRRKKKTR
jgi:hypothetical protein